MTHNNPEEAESLFRRAIPIYRAHIRQDKEFTSLRRSYAEFLQSAARFLEKNHSQEVEALLDEGIAVMRDDLARPTSARKKFFDTRFRWIIDHQASFLRRLARKTGVQPEQARQHLAKAQSLRLELIDVQRQMLIFNATETSRFTLLKSLQDESAFLLSPAAIPVGDPPPNENAPRILADAMLTEAIQLSRLLAAEFPGNADYRSRLADLEKLHAQHFGEKKDGDQ